MKVTFNIDILKWALQKSEQNFILSQNKFPKINSWLEKKDLPTYNQLVNLSKTLHIPFGYFFLSKLPDITYPISHFRTANAKENFQPSPELTDTIDIVNYRQQWIKDYLKEIGQQALEFVGSATIKNDYYQVAQQIRDILGLKDTWANKFRTWSEFYLHLLEHIENAGIFVVMNGIVGNNTHRKLDVNEFRGFVLADKYAPFIFINGRDAKSAQIFTLAHELAHIWLGKSASFDLRQLQPAANEIEKFCNKVAAEFLIPEMELKRLWQKIKNDVDVYQKVSRNFKVSEIVAARRLLDLNFISKEIFLKFYIDYQQKEIKEKKSGKGDFYNTQPYRIGKRFAQIIYTAVIEGKILYRDAYKLTGLHGRTFDKFVEKKVIS